MYHNICGRRSVMHRWHRAYLAVAAILTGVVILLYLLLPSQVWWFLFALGMIGLGLWMLRCC